MADGTTEPTPDGHDDEADSPRRRWEQGDDAEARRGAARHLGRRAVILIVPVLLVGVLITALGIPWWISVGALALVMAVLVFEIDI